MVSGRLLQAHLLEDGRDEGFAGRLQLVGENIRWRNTTWAVGESLDLESVTVQGAVAVAQDGLLVKNLRIQSSVLDLSGDGEVKMVAQDPVRAIEAAADSEGTAQRSAFAAAAATAPSGSSAASIVVFFREMKRTSERAG